MFAFVLKSDLICLIKSQNKWNFNFESHENPLKLWVFGKNNTFLNSTFKTDYSFNHGIFNVS